MTQHKLFSFKGGDIKTMLVGNKNETKKANESLLLDCFLGTKLGQKWYTKNKFTNKKDSEEPDFLFESEKSIHGLELVKFVRSGGDWQQINRIMQHITEQVHAYFLKHGHNIGIVIDAVNKEFLRTISLTYRYHGITKLEETPTAIKNKIIKAIEANLSSNKTFFRANVDLGTHWLRISVSINSGIETTPTFNCERVYFDLKPSDIQKLIDKKSELVPNYLKNCNKVSLLVVVDNEDVCFGPVTVTTKVRLHKYKSKFKNVFLLCVESGSCHSYKL